MKKGLFFLAVFTSFTLSAQKTFKQGDFEFRVTSKKTVEVSKSNSSKTGEIEIPSKVSNEGVTYVVSSIGESAFKWCEYTGITLPSSIDSIKESAFSGTKKLTKINLPANLSYLGKHTFSSSEALNNITIPDNITELPDDIFFGCKSLKNISLGKGLKKIGRAAFYKAAIEEITLPNTCDTIMNTAFLYCKSLKNVEMQGNLKYLGDGAFNGCSALRSINLPASTTHIGMECFLDCHALTEIKIPASCETLGESFIAKTGIKNITIDENNNNYKLIDGALFDKNGEILYAIPLKGVKTFIIPSSCNIIFSGAFWGSECEKVSLHEKVFAIGDFAFCQSALKDINLPNNITFIGEQAFASTSIESITLPAKLTFIGDGLFAEVKTLKNVTIPSGLQYIYNHAFMRDTNINEITFLGATPPRIADYYEDWDNPFYGLSNNIKVIVPGNALEAYQQVSEIKNFKIEASGPDVFISSGSEPSKDTEIKIKKGSQPMSFMLKFMDAPSIVENAPNIELREGTIVGPKIVKPDDGWKITVSGNNITLWGSDYDGYTCTFNPKETDYYLYIPAGIVKNASGDLNQAEYIHFTYKYEEEKVFINATETTPSNGGEVVLEGTEADLLFKVTFPEKVSIIDEVKVKPELHVGDKNGEMFKLKDGQIWNAKIDNNTTLIISIKDKDGKLSKFSPKNGQKYTIVIPSEIVETSQKAFNNEVVFSFSYKVIEQSKSELLGIKDNTFKDCIQLEEITLPSNAERIGEKAFAGCTNLNLIHIPNPLSKEYGNEAFPDQEGLKIYVRTQEVKNIIDKEFDFRKTTVIVGVPEAINTVSTENNYRIFIEENTLSINLSKDAVIRIFNLSGEQVAFGRADASSTKSFFLNEGIYAVQINNEIIKVIIK